MPGEISITLLYFPAYLCVCVKFSAIKITNINSLITHHFSKIHRSVLGKITIDLLYF